MLKNLISEVTPRNCLRYFCVMPQKMLLSCFMFNCQKGACRVSLRQKGKLVAFRSYCENREGTSGSVWGPSHPHVQEEQLLALHKPP